MIHYELLNSTTQEIPLRAIEAGLRAAEAKLGDIGERHISIEIVTEEESQALNSEFRNQNKPTDIISMSTQETKVGEQVITESTEGALDFTLTEQKSLEHSWPVIGQIILCLPVIQANSERAGQPLERELEWVVEHGVLHLMGFHHEHDD